MRELIDMIDDLGVVIEDLKVENMIADLLEHTSEAEKYEIRLHEVARSRIVLSIHDRICDLECVRKRLEEYHEKSKKIALVSCQLGGKADTNAIPYELLTSDVDMSTVSDIIPENQE